jgi:hypothetical protein
LGVGCQVMLPMDGLEPVEEPSETAWELIEAAIPSAEVPVSAYLLSFSWCDCASCLHIEKPYATVATSSRILTGLAPSVIADIFASLYDSMCVG